jgi:hypothetical protein
MRCLILFLLLAGVAGAQDSLGTTVHDQQVGVVSIHWDRPTTTGQFRVRSAAVNGVTPKTSGFIAVTRDRPTSFTLSGFPTHSVTTTFTLNQQNRPDIVIHIVRTADAIDLLPNGRELLDAAVRELNTPTAAADFGKRLRRVALNHWNFSAEADAQIAIKRGDAARARALDLTVIGAD